MNLYQLPQEVIDFRNKYALDIEAFNKLSISLPPTIREELKGALKSMPEALEGMIIDLQAQQDLILNQEGIRIPSLGFQYKIENDSIVKKNIKSNDPFINLANEVIQHFQEKEPEHLYANLRDSKRQANLESVLYINSFPPHIQNEILYYYSLVVPEKPNEREYYDISETLDNQRYDEALQRYQESLGSYEKQINRLQKIFELYNIDRNRIPLMHMGISQLVKVFQNHTFSAAKEISIDRSLSPIEIKLSEVINFITELEQQGFKNIAFSTENYITNTYLDADTEADITILDTFEISKNIDSFKTPIKETVIYENPINSLEEEIEYTKYISMTLTQLKSNLKDFAFLQDYNPHIPLSDSIESLELFLQKIKQSKEVVIDKEQKHKEELAQEQLAEETIQEAQNVENDDLPFHYKFKR